MDTSPFAGKKACCFTGHRPDAMPPPGSAEEALLQLRLTEAVTAAAEAGVTLFLNGGARGFDLMAAEVVLSVKSLYPDIRLVLELPSPHHADHWPAGDKARFCRVQAQSDEIHTAAEDNYPYAYLARNRHMVEQADCCLCYLKKARGGTLYTVNYALDRGITPINLYTVSMASSKEN